MTADSLPPEGGPEMFHVKHPRRADNYLKVTGGASADRYFFFSAELWDAESAYAAALAESRSRSSDHRVRISVWSRSGVEAFKYLPEAGESISPALAEAVARRSGCKAIDVQEYVVGTVWAAKDPKKHEQLSRIFRAIGQVFASMHQIGYVRSGEPRLTSGKQAA